MKAFLFLSLLLAVLFVATSSTQAKPRPAKMVSHPTNRSVNRIKRHKRWSLTTRTLMLQNNHRVLYKG